MAEGVDFSDPDRVEEWLAARPWGVAIALAARAALRLFPQVLASSTSLTNTKAKSNAMRLGCLRANLVSSSIGMSEGQHDQLVSELRHIASSAHLRDSLDTAFTDAENFGALYAAQRALEAAAVEDDYASSAFRAIYSSARDLAHVAAYTDVRRDTASPSGQFHHPLWPNSFSGHALADTWSQFKAENAGDPIWDFWIRWYQAMWDGAPLPWELTTEVALNDEAIWEAGPEAVAAKIAEIEARFDLKQRIEELEHQLAQVKAAPQIGHNNPPEPIVSGAEIKVALAALKTETEKEEPDRDRVRDALSVFQRAMLACVEWLGRKADLAVDTTIKVGVPAGGGLAVAHYTEFLERIIQATERWLPLLGP